jgi:hypothetical protein
LPRLVRINQYPSIDIADFWEVGEHPEEKDKPAYPAIQAGWFYGTTDQSWIYLGGRFRDYSPGDQIDRGTIDITTKQVGGHTVKHLVLRPEESFANGSIYVACFGRFDANPTFPYRRTRPCELRGKTHPYYAAKNRSCSGCGEMFGEDGRHPDYGVYQEDWVKIGISYRKDFLDSSQPNVEVLALRQTLRNRRFFLQLGVGSKLRLPGKSNIDEANAPDYLLAYDGFDVTFQIIPEEDELEELVSSVNDY